MYQVSDIHQIYNFNFIDYKRCPVFTEFDEELMKEPELTKIPQTWCLKLQSNRQLSLKEMPCLNCRLIEMGEMACYTDRCSQVGSLLALQVL